MRTLRACSMIALLLGCEVVSEVDQYTLADGEPPQDAAGDAAVLDAAGSPDDASLGVEAGMVDAGPPTVDAGAEDDAGSDDDAGPGDGGAPGPIDAGSMDAGRPDAGPIDAGRPDAGSFDAGRPDAGPMDAGAPDAGALDAGAPDGGGLDAGPSDAG